MAKADVLTLVSDFSVSQSNATEIAVMYDEIIRELGFSEVLTGTETITLMPDTAIYETAVSTIRALEFHSQNAGFLTKSDGRGLASLFGANWRTRTGSPLAVSHDNEDDNSFRVVPTPNLDDTLTVIRTETRDDVPVWLELPIAFEILHREFLRESDHQDVEMANLCKALATLLFHMVGVNNNGRTPQSSK